MSDPEPPVAPPDAPPDAPAEPLAAALLPDYAADLAWRPEQDAVAVACADGGVWMVDPHDGSSYEVARHDGGAARVTFSAEGLLASCGQDGRVVLGTGAAFAPGGWLEHLAWSPDGRLLAVGAGRQVQLWTGDGTLAAASQPLPATVEVLVFHPGGGHLAAGTHGGVTILAAEDASLVQRLDWTGTPVSLAFAPDGMSLACGTVEATLLLWDLGVSEARMLSGPRRKVRELAWRIDGHWLAAGGGADVTVWSFARGVPDGPTEAIALSAHRRPVAWLGFRPRTALLASAAADGYLLLWDLPSVGAPWGAATLREPLVTAAWSPDGTAIAAAGTRGTVGTFAIGTPPSAA